MALSMLEKLPDEIMVLIFQIVSDHEYEAARQHGSYVWGDGPDPG